MQTIMHRNKNRINGLFLDDGTWSVEPQVLQDEALRFYQHLFASEEVASPNALGEIPSPRLCSSGCEALIQEVTKEEVRVAIMSMNSFKAPGPDGFHPFFFKHYWEIVGDDVWHVVQEAFARGSLDSCLVETLIVLIPKTNQPVRLKDFHPISLCNVLYKIITKV